MKWFRFYNEAMHNPKVQGLRPVMFKHWVNLLCLASKEDAGGLLPEESEIAPRLGVRMSQLPAILACLTERGLLEWVEVDCKDGTRREQAACKNWTSWQQDSDNVARRVAKHRAKQRQDETLLKRSRVDKRREEKNTPPVSPPGGGADASAKPAKAATPEKATGMAEDWRPSDEGWAWAVGQWSAATVERETEKFRDHFLATGEKKARWEAAWRNWMRRHEEFQTRARAPAGRMALAVVGPDFRGLPAAEQVRRLEASVATLRGDLANGRAGPATAANLKRAEEQLARALGEGS